MDHLTHLPPPLIIEILSRLDDSADLARCRVVSRTLDGLSCEVRSVHLQCSFDRYARSRSPEARPAITPSWASRTRGKKCVAVC
ncbi:hypothetical protein RJ640_027332 [Escallonia rubra]|uniref:F-box domain-containing protein n=1 Tax=Escallonia rubra TaxID=112253 RepID=A0AA88USN4_9ASTE|nr:hypothetical protein RJ640_027332 [Escallonia rubra]